MLQVQNLSKSFITDTVLTAPASSYENEHIALIGPNGAGKSTVLRCITAQEQPDSGSIPLSPRNATVGYLPSLMTRATGSWARSGFGYRGLARGRTSLADQHRGSFHLRETSKPPCKPTPRRLPASRRSAATSASTAPPPSCRVSAWATYDRTHSRFHSQRRPEDPPRPRTLLLLREPQILLLDEPTNHLDVEALEWLEGFILDYPGSVLIVSHDRAFLDRTVTRTLFLDGKRASRELPGQLHRLRRGPRAGARSACRSVEAPAGVRRAVQSATSPPERRSPGYRALHHAAPARSAQDMPAVEAAVAKAGRTNWSGTCSLMSEWRSRAPSWWLKLDFGASPPGGRSVLRMEDVSFAYPGGPTLLQDFSLDVQYGESLALVGPNGAGKTTLLRLIEGNLQPSSGSLKLGANVRLGGLPRKGKR